MKAYFSTTRILYLPLTIIKFARPQVRRIIWTNLHHKDLDPFIALMKLFVLERLINIMFLSLVTKTNPTHQTTLSLQLEITYELTSRSTSVTY